jgi:putative ABC transport system ATP-binding protein
VIKLDHIGKTFHEGGRPRAVLHDVDLRVAAGERVALLGRSGSGKSTLLNLISGMDVPDAGALRVAGTDLVALDEAGRTRFRRRHVGFVYQFFNLIPTLTVAENVRLPLDLNGRRGAAAAARTAELLAAVDLADRADSFPDVLSGGEQQRVALARALVHAPPLVLADEPTGNLDDATGSRVLALLDRLVAEAGATLLMVTHSAEAAALADRVLHLDDGQLREVTG